MLDPVVLWNRATKLDRPTAADLRRELELGSLSPVSGHLPNWLVAERNFVVKLAPGRAFSEDENVISVLLIMSDDFFPANANVNTRKLSELEIFGHATSLSAQDFVAHLKEDDDDSRLTLTTQQDRWVLYYGDALAFTFFPLNTKETHDPRDSKLVAMEFFYQLVYVGRRPADILRA